MFQPCSPICVTQPICTSSTSAGSRSCARDKPFSTCAARSSPRTPASVPFLRPIGERTASTMKRVHHARTVLRLATAVRGARGRRARGRSSWMRQDRRRRSVDQLAHRVRDVAAEHDEAVVRLDDHGLVPGRVARREEHRDAVEQLGVAVELDVRLAVEMHPLDEVVRLDGRLELGALDVGRRPGEPAVAAAVVEVQMRVDHRDDVAELRPRHAAPAPTPRPVRASSRSSRCRRGSSPRAASIAQPNTGHSSPSTVTSQKCSGRTVFNPRAPARARVRASRAARTTG